MMLTQIAIGFVLHPAVLRGFRTLILFNMCTPGREDAGN